MKKSINWASKDFNDSSWEQASPLMREVGWPSPKTNAKPQALTPPWTSLVPRDIPYLIERDIVADHLIESTLIKTNIDDEPILLKGENTLTTKTGNTIELPATSDAQSWFLLYDFGEVINGMPKLDIQGAAGTEVQIVTAPFVLEDKFSKITVDSEFVDKIVLSCERDQWQATYFKPTRYLGIIVKNEEKLKLYSAGIHQLKYPFDQSGNIESQDAPWVKQYFEASAKTIDVCTTDGYTDNYRERRQYAQTGYYAALGNYWIFGDKAFQWRYLIQTSQEQEANGMMPAHAPVASEDYMIIMDSNCLWIRSLRNYLLYSGDYQTTWELLPAAKKLMGLLHGYTNSLGMIDNPPYAYWMDHALNDRRGANYTLNGYYLGSLEDFNELLTWLEEPDTELFQKRVDLLRESFQAHLWDSKKQLFADAFVDGSRSEMFSEHANAMALALGVATEEQGASISEQLLEDDEHNYIKRSSGMTMVTPAMSYFLHKGLCEYGFFDQSFDMFRNRFDKMLTPGTNGTLWEEWWLDAIGRSGTLQEGRTRSDAQTESAFPPALLAEFLLGATPVKPGMKEVVIKRKRTGLSHIKGIVPSPLGPLYLEWDLKKKNRTLELDVPQGMIIKLDARSLKLERSIQITVNEKPAQPGMEDQPYILLSAGKHLIAF